MGRRLGDWRATLAEPGMPAPLSLAGLPLLLLPFFETGSLESPPAGLAAGMSLCCSALLLLLPLLLPLPQFSSPGYEELQSTSPMLTSAPSGLQVTPGGTPFTLLLGIPPDIPPGILLGVSLDVPLGIPPGVSLRIPPGVPPAWGARLALARPPA